MKAEPKVNGSPLFRGSYGTFCSDTVVLFPDLPSLLVFLKDYGALLGIPPYPKWRCMNDIRD